MIVNPALVFTAKVSNPRNFTPTVEVSCPVYNDEAVWAYQREYRVNVYLDGAKFLFGAMAYQTGKFSIQSEYTQMVRKIIDLPSNMAEYVALAYATEPHTITDTPLDPSIVDTGTGGGDAVIVMTQRWG